MCGGAGEEVRFLGSRPFYVGRLRNLIKTNYCICLLHTSQKLRSCGLWAASTLLWGGLGRGKDSVRAERESEQENIIRINYLQLMA
jgi:hypothetical protein